VELEGLHFGEAREGGAHLPLLVGAVHRGTKMRVRTTSGRVSIDVVTGDAAGAGVRAACPEGRRLRAGGAPVFLATKMAFSSA